MRVGRIVHLVWVALQARSTGESTNEAGSLACYGLVNFVPVTASRRLTVTSSYSLALTIHGPLAHVRNQWTEASTVVIHDSYKDRLVRTVSTFFNGLQLGSRYRPLLPGRLILEHSRSTVQARKTALFDSCKASLRWWWPITAK
ncbi:hypothetical protein EDD16DRAFT_87506 [Pisolithus croceorrhizus]|nr:hypothetical protein EDD16DRAFT_87506 [Pisolithus croceorrhizus]KAI6160689.1 hypothetical protein EDD17DRAFT_757696 [Pisolithus thermaeus]